MAAAVGAMYAGIWYVPLGLAYGVDPLGFTSASCADQVRSEADALSDHAVLNTFLTCHIRQERLIALYLIAAGPIWALLTVAAHAVHPAILARRLNPVRDPDDGALRLARSGMTTGPDRAGRRVDILITRGTTGGARVFGAFGRYRMSVDSSLLVEQEDGHGLDIRSLSVLRHEEAHLRNRDVGLTYLTIASWWAFAVVLGVPLLVFLLAAGTVQVPNELAEYWRIVLGPIATVVPALIVLQAMRARVLRTREHYADVRAAQAGPAGDGLRAILTDMRSTDDRPTWWRRFRGYHPSPGSRLRVLGDPRPLAAISRGDLFIAGLTLGTGYLHLGVVGRLVTASAPFQAGPDVGLLLAAPIGAVVAAEVWNAVHAGSVRLRRAGTAATALASGILLGYSLPHLLFPGWSGFLLAPHPGLAMASAAALWAVCFAFLRWSALCARIWLEATQRRRAACAAGILCGAVVFGCAFTWWTGFTGTLANEGGLGPIAVGVALFTTATDSPALCAAAGCAAAFAVSASTWTTGTGTLARRPYMPMTAGIVLLAAFAAMTAALVMYSPSSSASLQRYTSVALIIIGLLTLLAIVVVSLGLGAWIGGRGRTGAALCAATVCAFTVAAPAPAVFVVGTATGCTVQNPSGSCWGSVWDTMREGYADPSAVTLVTIPLLAVFCSCALAGSLLRRAVDRLRPKHEPVASPSRRLRHRVGGAIAAASAVATALGAIFVPELSASAAPITEQRAELATQVAPETVSRDSACDAASTVLDASLETITIPGIPQDSRGSTLVALASSRDPVLAAMGGAVLDGAEVGSVRFFRSVNYYCDVVSKE
ncbi:M48 family metalloprotease [Nocardiopsis sediminis]|uniref:M48 family metalloprotease n=1 Tax=Nocardiopsis sediminis TaxID=1778267 RepID=A0ABV8FUL2_9ACTN